MLKNRTEERKGLTAALTSRPSAKGILMNGTDWLIVDTETDGLSDPIHVVEIAAQRMRGWQPAGEKFRVLLNHNVDIPPAAVAIHGYTKEFLRQHGMDPTCAHELFRNFAENLPLVSHNLAFDWNRALHPEWLRLRINPAGTRGFCTLMLSRRCVRETKSYSLDSLRSSFAIRSNNAHRAFGDVETMVSLFQQVYGPRLEAAGLTSYSQVAEFAAKTPVAKCLSLLYGSVPAGEKGQNRDRDSWYFIDSQNQYRCPLPAAAIAELSASVPCSVWREGMADWARSDQHPEFLQSLLPNEPAKKRKPKLPKAEPTTRLTEFRRICKRILSDGIVTSEEVAGLGTWLESGGPITEWPETELASLVEKILTDGVVTVEERSELSSRLQEIFGDQPSKGLSDADSPEAQLGPSSTRPALTGLANQNMNDYDARGLVAVCESIIADGEISGDELYCLAAWLNDHRDACFHWPGNLLVKPLQDVWADGKATKTEMRQIGRLLVRISKDWAKQQTEAAFEHAFDAASEIVNAIDLSQPRMPPIPYILRIKSHTEKGLFYDVDLSGPTCTCPDWRSKRYSLPQAHLSRCCKHVFDAYGQIQPPGGWPGWLGAFIGLSWSPHPLQQWMVLPTGRGPVLASTAPAGWANVYAYEGGSYDRFGYNIDEDRWAYGMEPTGGNQIRRAIINATQR
jgi:DNA polymerase-3 subunit epsilon